MQLLSVKSFNEAEKVCFVTFVVSTCRLIRLSLYFYKPILRQGDVVVIFVSLKQCHLLKFATDCRVKLQMKS